MTALQRALLKWYRRSGRHHLPWRTTRDPYAVLVSEMMLQQTQVERVLKSYRRFMTAFPTVHRLAAASTADVLRLWKGLGYNSRAVRLKRLAEVVVEEHQGALPQEHESLRRLPGVGPYTANAIRAFAFEHDAIALDTNVVRILHRLWHGVEFPPKVSAAALARDAIKFSPRGKSHTINSALMDLGALVCTARAPKCALCPLRAHCKSAPVDAAALEASRRAFIKNSGGDRLPFKSTMRFARGRVVDRLRGLPSGKAISFLQLQKELARQFVSQPKDALEQALSALESEGIVSRKGRRFALSD